jgi:hypothetical protein
MRIVFYKEVLKIALIGIACSTFDLFAQSAARVYPYPMDPREHPDDTRRGVKPPDAGTFKNQLQFIALRSMGNNYMTDLERYVVKDRLGDILWPHYSMLYHPACKEMVQEIKKRDLYLFGLWGFVPGPGKDFDCAEHDSGWRQFYAPEGLYECFEKELGMSWLGMDNGEQDGRYIAFAGQYSPFGDNRFEQYMYFQRHFERMGDILGNKLATLVSLNFGHYFLREQNYTLIGAETAQSLPNAQVYYSFIRGAGKQYGVPWFGNVSVFNRWGWKAYPANEDSAMHTNTAPPARAGSIRGTSLSLMKRLFMTQIFYNSVAVGFESSYYRADKLSPIGQIQRDARDWYEKYGTPGIMHTPIAVMADTHSGWTFPRHPYTSEIYRVWGNKSYEAGDYLTDNVLGMIYPLYYDASYFKDERGYNTPTPFGDCADALLSDAPLWLLRRYPVLVLAGEMTPSRELADTLRAYAEAGGHLVLTAANVATLFGGDPAFAAGTDARSVRRFALGKGRVTRFASPYGIVSTPQGKLPTAPLNLVEKDLARPFPLEPEVRAELAEIFKSQMIFRVSAKEDGDGLSYVTCCRKAGEYTLIICNNTWVEKPFKIEAVAGEITKIEEIPMGDTEKLDDGFFPMFQYGSKAGPEKPDAIACGSTRLFRVYLKEEGAVSQDAKIAATPNPKGRYLYLRGYRSIKEQVLARPTFFRHYDGVMVDWRYIHTRSSGTIRAEAGWIKRQGFEVLVDLTSGINLYPDIRIVDNDVVEKERSVAMLNDVLEKSAALGVKDILLARHRYLEQNMTAEKVRESMAKNLKWLCNEAAKKGVTLHMRQSPFRHTDLKDFPTWLKTVGEPNFKAAPSLGATNLDGKDPEWLLKQIEPAAGDLVLLSAAARDIYTQVTSIHEPIASTFDAAALKPLITALDQKGCRLVYDAIYDNADEEYADAKLIESLK